MTDAATIARARFVAEHWRDAMLNGRPEYRWVAHPLAMVLAALDGETDPDQCGIDPRAHEAFRALVGTETGDRPPLQEADGGRRGD